VERNKQISGELRTSFRT